MDAYHLLTTLGELDGADRVLTAIGRLIDLWNFEGNSVSGTQLFYWLDTYCRKKPMKDVNSALFEFADERTDGAWRASAER